MMVKRSIPSHKYKKEEAVRTSTFFSQIFKPINTARRQVTIKEIACTIERAER